MLRILWILWIRNILVPGSGSAKISTKTKNVVLNTTQIKIVN